MVLAERAQGGTLRKVMAVVGGPFVVVAGVAFGVVWWDRGAPPGFDPPIVDVEIGQITRDNRGVRLTGTAHYEAKVRQTASNGDSWTLFPLFPAGDTIGREVHVLVRTTLEPEDLYSFEDLVVEGMARPPGRLVPRAAREAIYDRGYSLTDDYVLVEQKVP